MYGRLVYELGARMARSVTSRHEGKSAPLLQQRQDNHCESRVHEGVKESEKNTEPKG